MTTIRSTLVGAVLALCAAGAFAGVELNKADQAALEGVKGIGPGLSGKLLEERKKGAYKSWEDMIDRVPGVGPGNAAKLSGAGLTINDAAFSGAPAAKPVKTADKSADKTAKPTP